MKEQLIKTLTKWGLIALKGALGALAAYLATSNPLIAGLVGAGIASLIEVLDKKIDTFGLMKATFGRPAEPDEILNGRK